MIVVTIIKRLQQRLEAEGDAEPVPLNQTFQWAQKRPFWTRGYLDKLLD